AVLMQDSGGVPLTPDQQAQAGLACGGLRATPTQGIPNGVCPAAQFTSSLISIPAPNAQNDDKNPPRIAPRNLFDLTIGEDNLLHRRGQDKRTLSARSEERRVGKECSGRRGASPGT